MEFGNGEVAKIAAQTMDNYLLAESRLRCKLLEQEELPKCIRRGRLFVKVPRVGENRKGQNVGEGKEDGNETF